MTKWQLKWSLTYLQIMNLKLEWKLWTYSIEKYTETNVNLISNELLNPQFLPWAPVEEHVISFRVSLLEMWSTEGQNQHCLDIFLESQALFWIYWIRTCILGGSEGDSWAPKIWEALLTYRKSSRSGRV